MAKKQHDIDNDPMFDTSKGAIDRAKNRVLESICVRVERLEEEKKGIADDIKDVKAEAKAQGYNGKMVNRMLTLRKMKPEVREEEDAIEDAYRDELGISRR
jgi:uncharacterized protein (UPF0335 family)